ncbi:hypothetical protein [Rhizobacter fulvus]
MSDDPPFVARLFVGAAARRGTLLTLLLMNGQYAFAVVARGET